LLERVRNGDAKVGEIKDYVRDALRNETLKQRQQAMLRLREAEAKRNVYQEAVRARVLANQSERLNQREQHMNQVMQNLSQRQEQLSERIDEISAQIEEHRNRRQD
jgi:response regulator RpfG family c-di-GMP phosphodiesterase